MYHSCPCFQVILYRRRHLTIQSSLITLHHLKTCFSSKHHENGSQVFGVQFGSAKPCLSLGNCRNMRLLRSILLAGYAIVVVGARRVSSSLDIKIASAGQTHIKATITNHGYHDLRLLNVGTILDKGPVKKLAIKSSSK
jgi:hypothetical protein